MIHSICYRVQAHSHLKPMEVCAGAEKALLFPAPTASYHTCFHAGSNGWGRGSHTDWGTEPASKIKNQQNKTKEDLFAVRSSSVEGWQWGPRLLKCEHETTP